MPDSLFRALYRNTWLIQQPFKVKILTLPTLQMRILQLCVWLNSPEAIGIGSVGAETSSLGLALHILKFPSRNLCDNHRGSTYAASCSDRKASRCSDRTRNFCGYYNTCHTCAQWWGRQAWFQQEQLTRNGVGSGLGREGLISNREQGTWVLKGGARPALWALDFLFIFFFEPTPILEEYACIYVRNYWIERSNWGVIGHIQLVGRCLSWQDTALC